jgi:hypothetical protein
MSAHYDPEVGSDTPSFSADEAPLVRRMLEIKEQIAAARDLDALKKALDDLCNWLIEDD